MSWTQIGRLLRTMFFLRVPLITLFLLAGLGPFALVPGEQLLGNLFDLRVADPAHLDASGTPTVAVGWTAWHLFSVAFSAFVLAWTAVAVINLVLHYGRDRFDDPVLDLDQKRPMQTFLFGLFCALVLVSCAIKQTQMNWLLRYGMPLLGLLCSLALVVLAKVTQLLFTDPSTTPHPPPFLVFPAYIVPSMERFFDSLYCWHSGGTRKIKGRLNGGSQWLLEVFRCAGQGYLVDCEAPAGKLILRSGHVFAIALATIALALYLGIGYAKGRIDDKPSFVPALGFFLLVLIVACWFLGALTFFFDRYRVPLVACLAVLSLATTYAPESDHFYRVDVHRGPPALLRPSDLVADFGKRRHKRLIAVATAGGGIQAAAWTARVLRGLEEECSKQVPPAANGDLRDSIVVISGVSGGSLGAMAYARSFTDIPTPVSPVSVVANAEASAIDEVGWGWTNPDLSRTILPWFRRQYIDRGWALEEKWRAIHHLRDFKRRKDVFLGDWAPSPENSMPALLLNATIVETGKPLVFSTTDFPRKSDTRGLVNFYDLFQDPHRGYDIRVNTAARLSASFPYVAPAARSNVTHPSVPDYHIVDGGYYDNYGIVSLLGWLQDAIDNPNVPAETRTEVKEELTDVLVLEIRPFAASAETTPHTRHGWGFQVVAPIDALLDVRDTGQSAHDDTELALFTSYYRARGIKVWRADFVYPKDFGEKHRGCLEAPLSWKLSQDQLTCIEEGWQQFRRDTKGGVVNPEIGCVVNFLGGMKTPNADLGKPKPGTVFCKPGDEPKL
jgi:predicted acylesterase/phospholipase RssA